VSVLSARRGDPRSGPRSAYASRCSRAPRAPRIRRHRARMVATQHPPATATTGAKLATVSSTGIPPMWAMTVMSTETAEVAEIHRARPIPACEAAR
jgi:hypothetical protein